MENCQNNSQRPAQKKALKDHLCHILGIMIKKYNHSYGACVMIVQTLPHYEHLSSVYADLIQTCVTQLGYESILPDILREFRHTIQSGGNAGQSSKDKENPNNKFYSQFLIDLVERLAPHFVPYLSLIQDLLDDESYLMRNAILYIYGELICRILNQNATNDDLKLKQMRNELLDTLMEHIHDSNALTRSKVLQIWRKISEEKSIPLHYINELMKRCIGRMEDVASSVRKSAFQLLCDLIRKNPYGIKCIEMSNEEIRTELEKEEAALAKLNEESDRLIDDINRIVEKNHASQSQKSTDIEMESEEDELNRTTTTGTSIQQSDEVKLQEKREKHQQMIILQTSKVNYLKDMLSFVNQIQNAIPKISRLLFSKTQTDVLEVISFFVTCYEHGFSDMIVGIRKMLVLVFNSEKTIKDAVVGAYKRLYLNNSSSGDTDGDSSAFSAVRIAKQLLKLVKELSICERDALEELIGECAASNELDNSVIKILWEFLATAEQSPQNRLNSIVLLGMIIKRVPAKGRANIQVLIDYGLSLPQGNDSVTDFDLLRVKETCQALSHITPEASTKLLTQIDPNSQVEQSKSSKSRRNARDKDNDDILSETTNNGGVSSSNGGMFQAKLQYTVEPYKLPNSHQIFERITENIVSQFTNKNTTKWLPMVESAINCIAKLADSPLDIIESIINQLIDKIPFLQKLCNKLPPVPQFSESAVNSTQMETQLASDSFLIWSDLMARFFNLIAVVATKVLIYMNQIVVCELKRRKMYKENIEKTSN
jgi:condensin complex subunit 1